MSRVPITALIGISNDEQGAQRSLDHCLSAMDHYSSDFGWAVLLFEFVDWQVKDSSAKAFAWQKLAAQQSIVAVYNYRMAAKGVRTQLRLCRTISAAVDHAVLEQSTQAFKAAFPHISELRQTVLHQGENLWNVERATVNSVRNIAVQSCLAGNSYLATFAGVEVRFEVSAAKAKLLKRICDDFFAAFPSICRPFQHSLGDK